MRWIGRLLRALLCLAWCSRGSVGGAHPGFDSNLVINLSETHLPCVKVRTFTTCFATDPPFEVRTQPDRAEGTDRLWSRACEVEPERLNLLERIPEPGLGYSHAFRVRGYLVYGQKYIRCSTISTKLRLVVCYFDQ